MEEEFEYLLKAAEQKAKKLWDNKFDEIWDKV